ncbi:MAG: alpha-L-fucosidase, partial [Oscillospiraceae bacterium]|nr:alpha-L-fucosidase [Oscillospiraceae bacterium]
MKKTIIILSSLVLLLFLAGGLMYSLSKTKNAADLSGDAWFDRPMPEDAAERISILPSERQVNQAETEFYAFFHYGINTYTGMEHGTGEEDPMLFNPAALDTDQWVAAIAAAGMKGAIITAKHHDGFCLWPTEYSEFSVKNSRYQGDVVAEFAKSCEKYGIKFGFYLSPFDKNAPSFGQGDAYND